MAPSTLLARLALGLALVWVAWQSLVPGDEVVAASPWDKANHLLAYAVLGLLAGLSLGRPSTRMNLAAWCGVVLFGLALEAGQALTPTRSAEALDLLADAAGAALGLIAAWAIRWRRSRRA